jgi:phosphate transporter
MGDLVLLQEDIERVEEEDLVNSGGAQGMTSGASDTDDEDGGSMDEAEGGTVGRIKGLKNVFSNPRNYDEANRVGRKAKAQRGPSTSRRARAASAVSVDEDADLLGGEDQNATGFTIKAPRTPVTPTLRRMQSGASRGSPSNMRRTSRMGMSTSVYADEDEFEGIWGSNSDWAIDTKIMYKRRITAVYTVSPMCARSDRVELTT